MSEDDYLHAAEIFGRIIDVGRLAGVVEATAVMRAHPYFGKRVITMSQ